MLGRGTRDERHYRPQRANRILRPMGIVNTMVGWVLRSPAHRLLSGSTALVRYTGPRTGRPITTPVQYAADGDQLVILVGRPRSKRWWRNFRQERALEVLLHRRWVPMTGRALSGADAADEVAALLATYLARFPKAERALDGDGADERLRSAVLVRCRPR